MVTGLDRYSATKRRIIYIISLYANVSVITLISIWLISICIWLPYSLEEGRRLCVFWHQSTHTCSLCSEATEKSKHTYTQQYAHLQAHMQAHIHTLTHTKYTHTYAHIQAHTHAHIQAHTCSHTQKWEGKTGLSHPGTGGTVSDQ